MSERSPFKRKKLFDFDTRAHGRLDGLDKHRGSIEQSGITGLCRWVCSCGEKEATDAYRYEVLAGLERHYEQAVKK